MPLPTVRGGVGNPPRLPARRVPCGAGVHPWFRPFLFKCEPKMAHFWFGLLSESGFANSGYFSLASEVVTHPPTSQLFTCVWGDLFNGVPLQTKCPHVHSSGLSQGCRPSLRASLGEKDARPPLRLLHYTPFLSLQNRSRPLSHHWHPV